MHIVPDPFLKALIDQEASLLLEVSKPKRRRIMKDIVPHDAGSLWITPQRKCFHVALTGTIKELLGPALRHEFSNEHGTDQDRIFWKLNAQQVERVVAALGTVSVRPAMAV